MAGWERDLQQLIERGRDREAVQLATRQLAPTLQRDRQAEADDATRAASTEGGT